jgi:hypothetical protein
MPKTEIMVGESWPYYWLNDGDSWGSKVERDIPQDKIDWINDVMKEHAMVQEYLTKEYHHDRPSD